jgi:hypothetical protein
MYQYSTTTLLENTPFTDIPADHHPKHSEITKPLQKLEQREAETMTLYSTKPIEGRALTDMCRAMVQVGLRVQHIDLG